MEIVDRIIKELRPIADKLGEGAEFLWYTLVKQMIIRGIAATIVSLAIAFVAYKLIPYGIEKFKGGRTIRGHTSNFWDGEKITGWWTTAIGIACAIFALTHFTYYALPRLINPSYYALYEIMRTVSGNA